MVGELREDGEAPTDIGINGEYEEGREVVADRRGKEEAGSLASNNAVLHTVGASLLQRSLSQASERPEEL